MKQLNKQSSSIKSRRNTYPRYIIAGLVLLLIAISLILTSCDNTNTDVEPEPERPKAASNKALTMPFFVADENGTSMAAVEKIDPAQMLYDVRKPSNVIKSPEGNPITWDEWDNVTGSATVKCVEGGTYVSLDVQGLIPGGLYTGWVVVFEEPGFSGTLQSLMKTIVGVAPVGAPDGSESIFRASESGTGQLTAITPRGSVLQFPSLKADWPDRRGIKECGLIEYEFHVIVDYKYTGETFEQSPGPAGTHVEQFGFIFKREDLQVIDPVDCPDDNRPCIAIL